MELKLILQIVGFSLGLLYLWLEYRANIYLWLVGLMMPLVHGILYFQSGLYADCAMNGYYLLAGLYGWLVWHHASKGKVGSQISHTPLGRWPVIVLSYAAVHVLIYWVLITFTNSTVPFWDSLTTALSVVAMWMLSRKYVEQWLVWLVVDVITVGLYLYKNIPITASLYLIYTMMAIAGYLRWRHVVRQQADA